MFLQVHLGPVSPWCPILAGGRAALVLCYPGIYAGQRRIRVLQVRVPDNDV
jgi:hypothetical protein